MLYTHALNPNPDWYIPTISECYTFWDTHEMLDNIRAHCFLVAKTALYLYRSLPHNSPHLWENYKNEEISQHLQKMDKAPTLDFIDKGLNEKSLVAAALLHDIAKTYTIKHGGDHSILGAAFVREYTGNPYLAHGVYAHISWHWAKAFPLSENTCVQKNDVLQSQKTYSIDKNPLTLPLLISYADKRVSHAKIVTLDERCHNLFQRYGKTQKNRDNIQANFDNAKEIERALFACGVNVHASEIEILAIDLEAY